MPNLKRPGVYVEEVLSAQNVGGAINSDSVAAFIGAANRGPVVPTLVSSWSEYTALFGDFTSGAFLPYAVFNFFSNGGSKAYIARVADEAGVAATRTLTDNGSTPQPTLSVSAASPGTWGNSVFVDVVSSTTSGRFDVIVKVGGVSASNIVERFLDLSIDSTDSRYAVGVVNEASKFVVLADLASPTAAPNNAPLPQTGTALAGGADGSATDAADVLRTVQGFDYVESPLVLNCAGITDAATLSSVLTYAEGTGRIFVVCDLAAGLTPAAAQSAAQALQSTSYGAAYYPWVQIVDPTKTGGVKKLVPPGGAIVGLFLKTDSDEGPYKTPAGVSARMAGVFATERKLSDAELDLLNSGNAAVNAIRVLPGYGICVMGGRTLKGGTADRYVAIRRSLIYIKKSVQDLTRPAIFEPNDQVLWAALRAMVSRFLREYHQKGGLRGATDDQAFFVRCDETNNTLAAIQAGEVHVDVGVALQYPAEFVVIRVGQYEGGSTASEA